jgi:hypothetical protein
LGCLKPRGARKSCMGTLEAGWRSRVVYTHNCGVEVVWRAMAVATRPVCVGAGFTRGGEGAPGVHGPEGPARMSAHGAMGRGTFTVHARHVGAASCAHWVLKRQSARNSGRSMWALEAKGRAQIRHGCTKFGGEDMHKHRRRLLQTQSCAWGMWHSKTTGHARHGGAASCARWVLKRQGARNSGRSMWALEAKGRAQIRHGCTRSRLMLERRVHPRWRR